MRLIDADALMKTLGITDMDCDKCAWHDKEWSRCKRGSDFEDVCCAIENTPTIEERKRGKWNTDKESPEYATCSVCGHCDWDCTESEYFNYCPNCGARMEGKDDG